MDIQENTKLSITTNTVAGGLPNEILTKVFKQLSRAATKNVRLTSQQWSELSASLMFKRIYFSPAKIVIENFTLISSNPLLCKNVTEVVYDARVFSLDSLSPASIEKKRESICQISAEFPKPEYEPLSNSQLEQVTQNLQHLHDEQQQILNNAVDTEALVIGLRNLPRLEDLTVLARRPYPDLANEGTFDPYPHIEYETKLDRLIDGAVFPKEDVLIANCVDPSRGHALWHKSGWTLQGTNNLFEAALIANVKIKRLRIGSQYGAGTPVFNLFCSAELCTRIGAVAKDASIVKIRCADAKSTFEDTSLIEDTLIDWSLCRNDALEMAAVGIGLIYEQTSEIRLLSFAGAALPLHICQTYLGKTMPLTVLTLKHMSIDAEYLKVFLLQHKVTLRVVKLMWIRLYEGQNWNDVAEAVGPVLSLDTIRFADTKIGTHGFDFFFATFGDEENYLRIAYKFLGLQEGMQSLFIGGYEGCSRKDRLSLRGVDPDVDWSFLRPVPLTD